MLIYSILSVFLFPISFAIPAQSKGYFKGCNHVQLTKDLLDLTSNYPNISRLYSIGKTVQERDLWVMVLSDSPQDRPTFRPQVKFVGNINGFSGPSCFLLMKFIKFILEEYNNGSEEIQHLLSSAEIHVLPNMNPDGFQKSLSGKCDRTEGRFNANGYEINRNFPDPFSAREDFTDLQNETLAIISWLKANNFLLSVSFISGAIVVTYPFDSYPFDMKHHDNEPHLTPDDDIFKHLSSLYVHLTGQDPDRWICPRLKRIFPGGTINGAEWSLVSGTMQDYNYHVGTFEIMVGLSCCRNDNNLTRLDRIWETQKPAMIRMIQEADYSVRGQILDDRGQPLQCQIQIKEDTQLNRGQGGITRKELMTNGRGEFWAFLPQGDFIIEVNVRGFEVARVPIQVNLIDPMPPQSIQLDRKIDKKENEFQRVLEEGNMQNDHFKDEEEVLFDKESSTSVEEVAESISKSDRIVPISSIYLIAFVLGHII